MAAAASQVGDSKARGRGRHAAATTVTVETVAIESISWDERRAGGVGTDWEERSRRGSGPGSSCPPARPRLLRHHR